MNSTNKKTRPPTTGARILVLEDDEAVGRVIFRRLEAAGHRVRVFAQAGPALDEIDGGACSTSIYST
jgi:DNA-binding response OmpR family regulator